MTDTSEPGDSGLPHRRAPSTVGGEQVPAPQPERRPPPDRTARILAIAIPAVLGVIGAVLIAVLVLGDRAPVDVGPRGGGERAATPVPPGTPISGMPAGGGSAGTRPGQAAAGGSGAAGQPGQAPGAGGPGMGAGGPTTISGGGAGATFSGTGTWPRFRNSNFNATSEQNVGLARSWPAGGPRKVWSLKMLGPGHAGAAIYQGRVFVLDYDVGKREDALRCLSLADGSEIWRTSYPVEIKDNHGISRTVPAVTERFVVSLGPMGHVTCARTDSGEVLWQVDLVKTYGTRIPGWYAGQCPLVDGGKAIIAPGGSALMVAIDCASGQVIWKTPNPKGWHMTHASITPISLGGQKTYVYPTTGGVGGVKASDGSLLWEYTGYTVNTAHVPSPVGVGDNRAFLTGGYGAGSVMLRINGASASPVWRIPQNVFGSHQHTPILYQNHLFGVAMDRQFVCLDLSGKRVWSSGHTTTFGIGPYILAEGMFYILSDDGTLVLAEASLSAWRELARAKVLAGPDAWAPMALADGMLVCRDRDTMVCLDVKNP
ncbi:MAG: PQQ-binding-like beta-propeller repeat protein [Armatimonadota bacterium]